VKALLIPACGPPRTVTLPAGDAAFMRAVRALAGTHCAERIQLTSRWEAWGDEDAAAAGKPPNPAATLIARSFGFRFTLTGTIIITGLARQRPASLSPGQASAILARITAPPP